MSTFLIGKNKYCWETWREIFFFILTDFTVRLGRFTLGLHSLLHMCMGRYLITEMGAKFDQNQYVSPPEARWLVYVHEQLVNNQDGDSGRKAPTERVRQAGPRCWQFF